MFSGEQKGKDVGGRGALGKTFEKPVPCTLGQQRELGVAPALAEETDEGATGTAFEVRVLDVIEHGKLEDSGGTAGALATAAASCAPFTAGDGLVLGELEEGVEEPIHHFLDDLCLDLVVQAVQ